MKLSKNHLILFSLISVVFFILDQYIKFIARTNKTFSYYIINKWFGWEYFENSGIAFSLPIPNILLIIITPLIIFALVMFLLKKYKKKTKLFLIGLNLVIAGAVSNLIDRFFFGVTIDYLRVLTSIINIADIMIVIGAGFLILEETLSA